MAKEDVKRLIPIRPDLDKWLNDYCYTERITRKDAVNDMIEKIMKQYTGELLHDPKRSKPE